MFHQGDLPEMLFAPLSQGQRQAAASASKYTALFGWGLRVADLSGIALTGMLAYWLRFGTLDIALEYQRHIGRGLLFSLVVLAVSPLYRSWRGRGMAAELWTMLGAYGAMFLLSLLYASALKLTSDISRLWGLTWFVTAVAAGTVSRFVLRAGAAWTRQRGMDLRTAVVVGRGEDAARIIRKLQQQPWAGIQVLGWFDTGAAGGLHPAATLLGDVEQLAGFVEDRHVNQVWVVLPMSEEVQIQRILDSLAHSTTDIKFVPDLLGLRLINHSVEVVVGVPVINLQQTPLQGDARVLKGIEDRMLAALILLMIFPVMVLIAIAVKLSSPGPVFYRQERMSWNNKTFGMLKFRSMPVDAEKQTGAVWARAGESRATRVGAFLRKTSLDELPQFINVLKGEMSIVGPRPERPVFVEKFKQEIPSYMKKHMVKAGITGWAQVNGWRGSTDLARRIECDLHYVENWSLAFDLKIIFMTLFKGFVNKNAY